VRTSTSALGDHGELPTSFWKTTVSGRDAAATGAPMALAREEPAKAPVRKDAALRSVGVPSSRGVALPFGDLLRLQRAIGNAATIRLTRPQPPHDVTPAVRLHRSMAKDQIQRRVKLTFEESEHEMEPIDPSTAKIIDVVAERDKTNVSVENKTPGSAQKAHTTSQTVFTYMWVRSLDQKTWLEAWAAVQRQFQFLDKLLKAWYADATLEDGSNKWIKTSLPLEIAAQIKICEAELTRDGHDLTSGSVWGARDKAGGVADWKYYDHEPDAMTDRVDPSTHLIRKWAPSLSSASVKKLENACERWMEIRGKIPWTSVDTESYVTGDSTGPKQTAKSADDFKAQANLNAGNAKQLAQNIATTFDFFPPSFTQTRTTDHAAGVAARHLVEHFQYHPEIKPGWRNSIKTQFLIVWLEKINREKTKEKTPPRVAAGNSKKKIKVVEGRDTEALQELIDNWDEVKGEFNRIYDLLIVAVTP
jgi:hypothetical protein